MSNTNNVSSEPEGVYELLERAENNLTELEDIRAKLPRFTGTSQEQAFFGLSKAIITCQRHVSLLMGVVEANGAKFYK